LIDAGIVSEVKSGSKPAFQPALGIDNIDIVKVINSYEHTGSDMSKYMKHKAYHSLEKKMMNVQKHQLTSEDNILLKDFENEK